jgi:hydroxyethylthiazole kinase
LSNPSDLIRVMPAEGDEMRPPEGEFSAVVAADIIDRVRVRAPRVHCITNAVAQAYTANVLLSVGAAPSMTISAEEVADFVAGADALLVNLGTLDASRREAIGVAVDAASEVGARWMLDPVFVDRSGARAAFAQALVRMRPAVIRLNRDEFAAMAAAKGAPEALAAYAIKTRTAVALTGEVDLVADGSQCVKIANGHPWMAQITGAGCAGAALIAACLAVEPEPWRAAAAGLLAFGVAAEIAAKSARGPGSLAVGIIDVLHGLSSSDLIARAKIA